MGVISRFEIMGAGRLALACLAVTIATGEPAAGDASDLQFDRTRIWVDAGAASGLADSGQTRFCLSLGGAWYLKPWLGIGLGVGLTDVFANTPMFGNGYHISIIPAFAQGEAILWRKETLNAFCMADVGGALWWTTSGLRDRAYGGVYLAIGVGARHRRPNSRVGMFTQMKFLPEVGPELAWPLLTFTIGIEG